MLVNYKPSTCDWEVIFIFSYLNQILSTKVSFSEIYYIIIR